MSTLERLKKYIKPLDSGCTAWLGGKDLDGYPMFWYKARTRRAARVLWQLTKGDIPDGLVVRHSCDNRECLNLAHLSLGTNKDNTADALSRGRMTGPRKVSPELAERINTLRAQKPRVPVAQIAKLCGISVSSVYTYLKASNKRQGNYAAGLVHWNSSIYRSN